MQRNSTTLFLQSTGAVTPLHWVNNAPDFTGFTESTLSVLQQAWQDFLDSGEELEVIPDPVPEIIPPAPNWDGFNAAMLANTEFNQITGVVLGIVPTVALGMPAALAQVSTNGVTAFALVFNAFCQIGNVSISQREDWANIAEGFNLPIEFVSVVRG